MYDQLAPVRIILGYEGFKTEQSLREAFLDYVGSKVEQHGYGVPSIPNLISANGNSLVKLTGHPYCSPLLEDGRWPILGSSANNPLIFLLEQIWTRITYIETMPELFGEDLDMESLNALLFVKPSKFPNTQEEKWGWIYSSISASQSILSQCETTKSWEPIFLDKEQFVIVHELCMGRDIEIGDDDLKDFLQSKRPGLQVGDFVQSLVRTTLVALDGDKLELTTAECACVLLPDGRRIAAENNTGRLTRWVSRYMDARATAKDK